MFGNQGASSYNELQGSPMDPHDHPITNLEGKQFLGLSDMDGMPIKQGMALKKDKKK